MPVGVCNFDVGLGFELNDFLCPGLPVLGVVIILLLVIICCIGVCVRKRQKRGNLDVNNEGYSKSETLEMAAAPIDLATGQMNQQNNAMSSVTKVHSMSTNNNVENEEIKKSYIDKKSNIDLKPEAQAPLLPPPREKAVSVSHERTTSLSGELKRSVLVNSANSNKLLLVSNEPSPGSQICSAGLKKVTYNDAKPVQENPQQEKRETGGLTHDDIATPLEVSIHLPSQKTGSSKEPRYHINRYDSSEEKNITDISASKDHDHKPDLKQKKAISKPQISPAKDVAHTSQQRKHVYEEVSAEHNSKLTSTSTNNPDSDGTQDRYNVLSNQLDMIQVQSGVVQEDPAESPVEDSYYSTARVHRLVPVGKPIGSQGSSHLYQALDEQGQSNRHNTFSNSIASSNIQRSKEHLVRTYSSTAQSLEKLDPMYDEPYKPQRSGSLSKLDIYNVGSLFDDPKYGTKESTLAESCHVFEDPAHLIKAAAKDSRTVSQDTGRHVSFSADTKTAVGESPKESGVRPAAVRKTK